MKDIFEFWAEMPLDSYIHPEDQQVFDRFETSSKKHQFELKCLPGAYCGPLKDAKVVLLFLSPGLDEQDIEHAKSAKARKFYAAQRTGTASLPAAGEHDSARDWLTGVIKQFGISYEEARESRALATLNIGAYKSKTFPDWHMLAALPSSRRTLDWAQSALFPEAEKGERIVVCLRSADYWGLGTGEPIGTLFRPTCNRNARMIHGEGRKQIEKVVQLTVREQL
jgi:hypothetical protein